MTMTTEKGVHAEETKNGRKSDLGGVDVRLKTFSRFF